VFSFSLHILPKSVSEIAQLDRNTCTMPLMHVILQPENTMFISDFSVFGHAACFKNCALHEENVSKC
jgi:hypothetical protein